MDHSTIAPSRLFLVAGATGTQGGAVARALLRAGYRVRALTRTPESVPARELAAEGVELHQADLDSPESLAAAMVGVRGVFSVQATDKTGTDSERRHGFALIRAALHAHVEHFVHSSVAQAGMHAHFPRWGEGYWSEKYWTDKWDVEGAVRNAGFRHWTILKPVMLMENLALPKARLLYPHLGHGEIHTAAKPGTRLQFIAADDVGQFAAMAFGSPDAFHGQSLSLAAEAPTTEELARTLEVALGRTVRVHFESAAQAKASGSDLARVRSQEWLDVVGYQVDTEAMAKYPVRLTTLREWVQRNAHRIHIGDPAHAGGSR